MSDFDRKCCVCKKETQEAKESSILLSSEFPYKNKVWGESVYAFCCSSCFLAYCKRITLTKKRGLEKMNQTDEQVAVAFTEGNTYYCETQRVPMADGIVYSRGAKIKMEQQVVKVFCDGLEK